MPGGLKSGTKQKSRHVKVKKQKKKFIRSKDPIQAVLMWGVQHSVSSISSSISSLSSSFLLPQTLPSIPSPPSLAPYSLSPRSPFSIYLSIAFLTIKICFE